MWFVVFIALSFYTPSPADVAYQDRIPCDNDLRCLSGECWEGFCNEEGYCRSMWTCA